MVTVNNDNLQAFFCAWDTVLSGLWAAPQTSMLAALLLRQIREREAMEQDFASRNLLSSDSPDKSYDYLLRCCRRVIERNRLEWARSELSKLVAQGGRALVTKGKGKDGDKDKEKDKKGKGSGSSNKKDKAAGDRCREKSISRNRFESWDKAKLPSDVLPVSP